MSDLLSRADLVALPKAHLHLHLEGSARHATINELAERTGVLLPPLREFSTFAQFDDLYLAMLGVITTPDDLARICRELVEDEAAVGVRYLEPSINAFYWADRFGISHWEALAVMRHAFDDAGRRHEVEIGLMVGCPRAFGVRTAEAMAKFSAEHAGAGVVAFGICGDEPKNAHLPYRRACAIAKGAGLLVVPHAGEEQGAASVQDALEYLDPDRIAHGFRAAEDPAVLALLANRGVVCDVCLSSNVGVGSVKDFGSHPLKQMLASGVRVTLGADDSLFFGADLADEYDRAQRWCGVEASGLAEIARDSARASGATAQTVAKLLAGIDAWEHGGVSTQTRASRS